MVAPGPVAHVFLSKVGLVVATLWHGSPALMFFVGLSGAESDLESSSSSSSSSSPSMLPAALCALHGGAVAAALVAGATAASGPWCGASAATARRVVASSRGTRNLTDRAIREHSKLHAFLHGSNDDDDDDDNCSSGGGTFPQEVGSGAALGHASEAADAEAGALAPTAKSCAGSDGE